MRTGAEGTPAVWRRGTQCEAGLDASMGRSTESSSSLFRTRRGLVAKRGSDARSGRPIASTWRGDGEEEEGVRMVTVNSRYHREKMNVKRSV